MRCTIEKCVFGGSGLARTDEGVVLVDGVLPGEEVEVEPALRRGGVLTAALKTVITPSEHRRTPPCPFARQCGGCEWQHIDYPEQVRIKQEIIADCFRRIGRLTDPIDLQTFVSPPFEYRIRVQFQTNPTLQTIGFFERSTNTIVDIDRCMQLTPPLNHLLDKKKELFSLLPRRCEQLKAIADSNGCATWPTLRGLSSDRVHIPVGPLKFIASGDGFFQSNRFLVQTMAEWARPFIEGTLFADVYGGNGLFSIALANKFKKGVLVEIDSRLCALAKQNFGLNAVTNVECLPIAAERFFLNPLPEHRFPDCVILDPPRPGLSKAVRDALCNHPPPALLYFSCNVSTQARDVALLRERCGYRIEQAAFFECYPQTSHIETALILRR